MYNENWNQLHWGITEGQFFKALANSEWVYSFYGVLIFIRKRDLLAPSLDDI